MFPPAKIMSEMGAYNSTNEIYSELINFYETSCKAFNILEKRAIRQIFKRKVFIHLMNAISNSRLMINDFVEQYKIYEEKIMQKNKELQIEEEKNIYLTNEEKKYFKELEEEERKRNEYIAKSDQLRRFVKKSLDRLVRNGQEPREYNSKSKFNYLEYMI